MGEREGESSVFGLEGSCFFRENPRGFRPSSRSGIQVARRSRGLWGQAGSARTLGPRSPGAPPRGAKPAPQCRGAGAAVRPPGRVVAPERGVASAGLLTRRDPERNRSPGHSPRQEGGRGCAPAREQRWTRNRRRSRGPGRATPEEGGKPRGRCALPSAAGRACRDASPRGGAGGRGVQPSSALCYVPLLGC